MDRVPFGIKELDESMGGGIPKGNLVLLSGGAGTGKSTLCLQYLVNGALNGEKGVYITTEQNQEELIKQSKSYNFPLEEAIEKGNIKIVRLDILKEGGIISRIRDSVNEFSPSRIVIDSLSTFSEYAATTDLARDMFLKRGGAMNREIDHISPQAISERTMVKRMLATLIAEIRAYGATALLTSELPEKGETLSSDGISEFLADGVILLKALSVGDTLSRTLELKKMRYTKINGGINTYELTDNGLIMDSG